MTEIKSPPDGIDWRLTTWEGSRREQLRRWAQLPLERIIQALEEMEELSEALASSPQATDGVHERQSHYNRGTGESHLQDDQGGDDR